MESHQAFQLVGHGWHGGQPQLTSGQLPFPWLQGPTIDGQFEQFQVYGLEQQLGRGALGGRDRQPGPHQNMVCK